MNVLLNYNDRLLSEFSGGEGDDEVKQLLSAIITAVQSIFYRVMHFVRRAVETVNTVSGQEFMVSRWVRLDRFLRISHTVCFPMCSDDGRRSERPYYGSPTAVHRQWEGNWPVGGTVHGQLFHDRTDPVRCHNFQTIYCRMQLVHSCNDYML